MRIVVHASMLGVGVVAIAATSATTSTHAPDKVFVYPRVWT